MLARNEHYVDLSKPSLKGLIFALRHREYWPAGFSWHFPDCNRCAIGLAGALWREELGHPTSFDVLIALKLISDGAWTCDPAVMRWREPFMHGNSDTTPEYVADRLEAKYQQQELVLT